MLSMLILEIRLHQVIQSAAFVEIEHNLGASNVDIVIVAT
jgi:hypothetical protein